MKSSNGGVTLDSVMDMTFPDLVDLWEIAFLTG